MVEAEENMPKPQYNYPLYIRERERSEAVFLCWRLKRAFQNHNTITPLTSESVSVRKRSRITMVEAEKNHVKKHDKSMPRMLERHRSEAGSLRWRLKGIMSKSITKQCPRCWRVIVR